MKKRFRIWCGNNKEWEKDTTVLLPNGELYDLKHRMIVNPDNHVICWDTGEVDITGIPLYENDIVKTDHEITPYARVYIDGIQLGDSGGSASRKGFHLYKMEKIGNIFENPEMLK